MKYRNRESGLIVTLVSKDNIKAVIDSPGVNHKMRRHTLSVTKFDKVHSKVG